MNPLKDSCRELSSMPVKRAAGDDVNGTCWVFQNGVELKLTVGKPPEMVPRQRIVEDFNETVPAISLGRVHHCIPGHDR